MNSTATNTTLHVVLGASGAVGSALMGELARQGLPARAVSRTRPTALPAGTDWLAADLSSAPSVERAVQGAGVVYLAAQPAYTRWALDFPPILDAVIGGVGRVGARLVFADNLYSYGPVTTPLREDSPERPQSRKGQVRLALARTLLDAHRAGVLPVTIGRASDFYGPGVHGSLVGAPFFRAIVAGKRPPWIERSDQLHSFSFIDDVARGLVTLAQHGPAFGEVWHLPAAEALTATGFAALIAQEAQTAPPRPRALSGLPLRALALFSPLIRELADVQYQVAAPFTVDGTRFTSTFGGQPTPHRSAIRQTLAWLRAGSLEPSPAEEVAGSPL
ncbi:NAD-dependent epimerase/dehydratase family protein [Deinococcus koreensis]|uniref:NAD-dependent dehydratase n=1 Tax=Deinococcus koreensis TaxID=2054903 RepID=A0A2K3UTD1_9DEIO|nr:NAD-dependent epimerase/dehydratase family protein [Deinococcus koreensis]PNY79804.1 NAD-dependent dehydratase [Deinococcus koreensis]